MVEHSSLFILHFSFKSKSKSLYFDSNEEWRMNNEECFIRNSASSLFTSTNWLCPHFLADSSQRKGPIRKPLPSRTEGHHRKTYGLLLLPRDSFCSYLLHVCTNRRSSIYFPLYFLQLSVTAV